MKPSFAYLAVSTFAAAGLSATTDQYRDQVQTAENPQAVDAIKTDAPNNDTAATAAPQIGRSCAESLSSESCGPSPNSTDMGAGIKKGGGHSSGHGGGKGVNGGGGYSGVPRVDSHGVALVLTAGCLCAAVTSLI
ncbi:hypothetical protein F5B21DRAFT_397945 [Xylaria acuta]|nr:hypothetical protein F5B21DRAFT_397945 [Xylaria acuta]